MKEALRLALVALQRFIKYDYNGNPFDGKDVEGAEAITAIKAALAQPAQEPVEFEEWHKENYMQSLEKYGESYKNNHVRCRHQGWLGAQSSSPQRTWAGLTDKVITQVIDSMPKKMRGFIVDWDLYELARAIESKLKQKNGFTEEKNT